MLNLQPVRVVAHRKLPENLNKVKTNTPNTHANKIASVMYFLRELRSRETGVFMAVLGYFITGAISNV